MSQGSVIYKNGTQAVLMPADMRFPDGVKNVTVRKIGKDLILSPVENTWDSFFHSNESVTDDFMEERNDQAQADREQL
jgi:antitoxin VapB